MGCNMNYANREAKRAMQYFLMRMLTMADHRLALAHPPAVACEICLYAQPPQCY